MNPAETAAGRPLVDQVLAALEGVIDPELGMSIVELGLLHDVTVDGDTVRVVMTLTAPGCPLHELMPEWVRAAALTVPGIRKADVTLTFDPPWSPDRIGRRELRSRSA